MSLVRSSARSYKALASDYDAVRFSGPSGSFLFENDGRIIRELVRSTGAQRALDAPVGTGRVLVYLRDLDLDIVGLDFTEEMLSEAEKVADHERHTLIQGNAAEMPFGDDEFDCLTSLRFFHLFKRKDRLPFAEEFVRVVKPGGFLIVSFTNGWYAGGINWLKKKWGCKTVEFEHMGELGTLFPNCTVKRCVGNFLPKQWMLDRIPLLGKLVRWSTSVYPLNRLCWERIYLLQTQGVSDG